MAQKRERAAPRQRTALTRNTKSLDSFDMQSTAPEPFRQGAPAAWIVRRVPVSLAAARVYAELHGIGGAHA